MASRSFYKLCFLSGRIQKLHASLKLPAAEASSLWGVFCLPRSPWQRSSSGRPLWWEASPGLHPNQRKTGPVKGVPQITAARSLKIYTNCTHNIIFFFFWAESCCRQAGEKEPGALKKKRRKGEGGKNEEEVSTDVKCFNVYTCFNVYMHCKISIRLLLLHVEPDHAAGNIKGKSLILLLFVMISHCTRRWHPLSLRSRSRDRRRRRSRSTSRDRRRSRSRSRERRRRHRSRSGSRTRGHRHSHEHGSRHK